jgi:hypothetical protein
MDIEKIFDLFDTPDEPKKQVIMDISEHPAFWIGMFRKIIMNHSNFSSAQLSVFKTAFPNMDINDIRNAGEFIIYTRSYGFLQKLDIERELDLQILKDSTSTELVVSLKLSISYFESIEEYEKCAFLMKILTIVEGSLT